jgi:hypothetical protein
MLPLVQLMMFATLIWLCWQDFRERLISILSLIVFAVLALMHSAYWHYSIYDVFFDLGIGVLFLAAQFMLVALVFYFKNRDEVFFDSKIGWGDVVFLLITAFLFSPVNFIIVYASGLIFVLLMHFIMQNKFEFAKGVIPFAGYFSIYLVIILALSYAFKISLYDNFWLLQLMGNLYG